MTKTIWKYDVPSSRSQAKLSGGRFDMHMPVGAEIVCLDKQHDLPKLWVLLNPEYTEREQRHFLIVGTGGKIPDGAIYIGSWQMSEGDLVWHLFEYI